MSYATEVQLNGSGVPVGSPASVASMFPSNIFYKDNDSGNYYQYQFGHWVSISESDMKAATGSGGGGGGSSTDFPTSIEPKLSSGGNITVAATSSSATAFASQTCSQLTVINNQTSAITVTQAGVGVPVLPNTYFTFFGLTNANELSVKLASGAAGATIGARWEG